MATYKSPWRYTQQVDVTNARYENKLDGESFMQLDLRLTKYMTIAGFRGGLFIEVLNVLVFLVAIEVTVYMLSGIKP